jgi:hypothetical protein
MIEYQDIQNGLMKLLDKAFFIPKIAEAIPFYSAVVPGKPYPYGVIEIPDVTENGTKTFDAAEYIIRVTAYSGGDKVGYFYCNAITREAYKILIKQGECISIAEAGISDFRFLNSFRSNDGQTFQISAEYVCEIDTGRPNPNI